MLNRYTTISVYCIRKQYKGNKVSSKYKVQGSVLPADKLKGEHIVQSRIISKWVDADSPLDAACKFIMDNDEVDALTETPAYYAGMDMEEQEAFTKIYNRILDEINTWDFYNKNLCIAYFTTGLSLDKLVKELGIGRSSIYNTIRNHREIIQEKFSEDVEDFYNKDYDKI